MELAGVVQQHGYVQSDVGATATQTDQAHGRELLLVAFAFVVHQVRRAREHAVPQAVEVVEDAVGIGFGEIKVLMSRQGPRAARWFRELGRASGRGSVGEYVCI